MRVARSAQAIGRVIFGMMDEIAGERMAGRREGEALKRMRITPESLYKAYVEEVVGPLVSREYAEDTNLPVTVWTDETLGFFCKLGQAKAYRVFTNRRTFEKVDERSYEEFSEHYGAPPKEFLVDLCWLGGDKSQRPFPRMRLALEVEWAPWRNPHPSCWPATVDEDVMKLLYLQADLKVAILGCTKNGKVCLRWTEAEAVAKDVEGYMTKERMGETLLLVFLANPDRDDEVGVKVYIVGEGTRDELRSYPYEGLSALH